MKEMHIHDFLASEYDTENVVVTKTKLKPQEKPQMPALFSPKNSAMDQREETKMRQNKQDSNATENAFLGEMRQISKKAQRKQ